MGANKLSDPWIVLLGTLLYSAGSAIFYLMPPYLAFLGGRLSLDPGQLGTLAAAESAAIGVASLFGPLWIDRIDRRFAMGFAALVCIGGNLASGFLGGFGAVLACRVVIGLLGEGVFYTACCAVLTQARNVDRAFGIALTVAVIYGALVTGSSPFLVRLFPVVGPMSGLILIGAAVLPFVFMFDRLKPATEVRTQAQVDAPRGGTGIAFVALLGQALWYGAPGAFWTFVEQVATDKGVPTSTAEFAISAGEMAGLLGGVAATILGDRWGRFWPIVSATAGLVIPAILFQMSTGAFALALFLGIFYIFWNYGTVYQMSFTASMDWTGRATVMIPAAQVFGLSFGPYAAGELIVGHGDGAVTVSTVVFALSGLALYFVCFARQRRIGLAAV